MSIDTSRRRCTRASVGAVFTIAFLVAASPAPAATATIRHAADADVAGTITDSASAQPLAGSEVSITQDGRIIVNTITDAFGRYRVHDLATGQYVVHARYIGYRPDSVTVAVPASGATVRVDFRLVSVPISLAAVQVSAAQAPVAVNTRTGSQIFQQDNYHGAPTATTSQIIQQSLTGAARAPTGEVHIRGQHAEYTYYVDGVPVPSGISGSLNELFDPSVVNQIDFQTGGWDAEYGGKNAAIINITTKIPTGPFHANLSTYAGSYQTNGQALSLSSQQGQWGFFVSGARQETAMRQEPVMGDSVTNAPINFHDYGIDAFGFGKVQYTPTGHDVLDLEANLSQTRFAVPYDTSGGTFLNDHQRDVNGFINLGWRHAFGDSVESEHPKELFAGLFYRHGSLQYEPGAGDESSFIFYPDTTPYNLRENRSFDTYGVKADYSFSPSHVIGFKIGTLDAVTRGSEAFTTFGAGGQPGPASTSNLNGSDLSGYAQTVVSPSERWELRTGLRYDAHAAPFAGTQTQWSPRVKLSYFPNPGTTIYAYYGRLFIPTNVEDLRAITSIADSGVAALPTLPERDDFYELGVVRQFGFGLSAKLAGYHKSSSPGIDDNTVPGSAIVTDVNIQRVHITGIEATLSYRPAGEISGYLNFAINHAYGSGTITGGFFPTEPPQVPFDLDHDQRISAVASVNWAPGKAFLNATGIYGSGLTNGVTPEFPPGSPDEAAYGTGLFDFNTAYKVKSSFIVNLSGGYSLIVGGTVLQPQVYVDNLFDLKYVLKGAFFSGASYGRPRTVEFRLNVGI